MSQSLEQEVNELRSMLVAFISGQTPNAAQVQAFLRAQAANEAAAQADADAERARSARAKIAEGEALIARGEQMCAEGRAELGGDADGEPVTEPRRVRTRSDAGRRITAAEGAGETKRQRIRELVDGSKGLFVEQITSATGYTPSAVHTHVRTLEEAGHVWTERNVFNPDSGRSTGTKVYPRSMMRRKRAK